MRDGAGERARCVSRAERAALGFLYAFTALAVAGYASFGRHPGLLSALPAPLAAVYPVAFAFFAQAHVWLAGLVLGWTLFRRAGRGWVAALVVLYATSLAGELAGTGWGVPFGAYAYGDALGPAWASRVPAVIPLSWFLMAVPSYAIARRAYPDRSDAVGRIAVAAAVLVAWDLALDPAMSRATRYWTWSETGPYYGMPWLNLAGWYLTGLVLMAELVVLRADRWIARVRTEWLIGFYGANLLLPAGMNLAAGYWGAVVAPLAAVGGLGGWIAYRRRRGGRERGRVPGRLEAS